MGTGECLKTFYGHSGTVFGLDVISSEQFCSGSQDKLVKLWCIKAGCLKTFTGHSNMVQCVAVISSELIVSGSTDSSIRIW